MAISRRLAPLRPYTGMLGLLAGVCYSSWILEFPLDARIDPVQGYVSELSAAGQPWAWLFSGGDLISGALTILLALACLREGARLGWTMLLLFGISSVGDALFTMDCAPSTDTACALRERSGAVSFSHRFHDVTSSLVVAFGIAALVSLSVAGRRGRRWPLLSRWGAVLAVAEAATAIATLALMYAGTWLGLMQRVQITVLSLGLLLIAWEVFSDRHVPPGSSAPATARPPLIGSGHR